MQHEREGQTTAYVYDLTRLRQNDGVVPHPVQRRADETWAAVPQIESAQIEAELELGRRMFFTAPSTGRRYLSIILDLLRCGERDPTIATNLPNLFSRGKHLEGALCP